MLLRRSPHSFSRHSLLLLHASALFLLLELAGAQTTTTFDDTDSSFSWYGEWTPVAGDCSWCASKVDPTQTYGGTWHDGNHVVTSSEQTGGSFAFTGTAVSIYGIDQSTNGAAPDIVFTLEGFTSTHHYTGTSNDKVYHSLFFSHSGLANGAHTVNWVLNVDPSTPSSADEVVALFDYAVVTSAVNSDTGGGGGGGGGTTTTTTTGGSGGGGGTGPGTTTTTTGGSGGGGGGGGSTISGTNSLKSSSSSIR
ncbi:hypothetical protein C8F01DRAFT_761197 [Mycena amicta]|nr:hypothetical protein C8F01DRAFT_761197 [Mycena amicta]